MLIRRIVARTASLFLAAVLTLGMLGGIDHLATSDAPGADWASRVATPHRA